MVNLKITGDFVLSHGVDILQCILSGVERVESHKLHDSLELGQVVDTGLHLKATKSQKSRHVASFVYES